MDNEDLVSYYLKKSQDWIFIPQFRTVKIDDDEILDLDSMNLDSNEDTWLYSSNEKSELKDSRESMEHEELEKEFGSSNEAESKKEQLDVAFSPLSPLLGPEDFHHPSFLNSMDEMSDTALEDLLHTPLTSRSKSTLLRKALANSYSSSDFNTPSVNGSGHISGATTVAQAENVATEDATDAVFKKPSSPPASDSVAKSYILHSVENKLFNLADVTSTAELIKNRDIRNAEIARKTAASAAERITEDDVDALCRRFDKVKTPGGGSIGAGGGSLGDINDENSLMKQPPSFAWHSTPHQENAHRPPSRRSFMQQPTPILLNRYLKHKQQQAAEISNLLSRQLAADESVKGETNSELRHSPEFEEEEERRLRRLNEMSVSYVKYESEDCSKLPRIDDGAGQNGLRSSFSKSDDVLNSSCNELNSTFDLRLEDDAASSTSESSLSSMSHKLTLSIQEVQKMADLQERSLKKQVYSSYYAGSSKSSEVSSSNESVSTYGALSNEGSIDINPAPKIAKGIQPPKARVSHIREPPPTCNLKTNSRISTFNRPSSKINLQPNKLACTVDVKPVPGTPAVNESKPSLTYKSKISTANGRYSNTSQSPSRKTQSLPTRPLTVPPKLVVPASAENTNEIVSIKEITNMSTNQTSSNSGPASHIPRPASKIPMFRSSSSRSRFGKS